MTKGKRWALGCLTVFASFAMLFGGCLYFGFRAANASQPGADRFHQLYNVGDWKTIWTEADTHWRLAMDRAESDRCLDAMRKVLGKHIASKRTGWFVRTGECVDVSYAATFEMGEGIETFRWFSGAGVRRLGGYDIQSPMFDRAPAAAPQKK